MRGNQVKLEEQLKIEVAKNATLVTEKNALAVKLATQDEVIDEKDATIEKWREENARLIQELKQHGQSSENTPSTGSGAKRRHIRSDENSPAEPEKASLLITLNILMYFQERFVVFGFGENGLQHLGLVEGDTYPKVKITDVKWPRLQDASSKCNVGLQFRRFWRRVVFKMGPNFGGATPRLIELASVADVSIKLHGVSTVRARAAVIQATIAITDTSPSRLLSAASITITFVKYQLEIISPFSAAQWIERTFK